MRNFWIVIGSEKNWRQAFVSKGIWGLEETSRDKIYWLAVIPDDLIFFYLTGRVKGIIGYGIIRSKFYQNVPLWEAEIKEGLVKWPLRFEFDVEFLLPEDNWESEKFSIPRGAEFRQPLILKKWEEVEGIIRKLNPSISVEKFSRSSVVLPYEEKKEVQPTHEEIKNLILEIGKLQGFIANKEFPMGTERLDSVWRRLPESVPTYVFEVQVGGDLYHAIGKLKHAYDIWNSRIFLVASKDVLGSVNHLISGTFHEIKSVLKFIDVDKVLNLHKAKIDIYNIEKNLGIIP